MDSRSFPFAQSAEEVAEVIADVIANPRAEVYTRPRYAEQVKSYYNAEDPATIQAQAPFLPAPDTSK